MILAIYNCYCIPVDVAFSPPEFNTTLVKTINGMIDFAFFIDILVSFRTTFMDQKTGHEIHDSKRMATEYLKGQFTIDCLATIPFDTIAGFFIDAS